MALHLTMRWSELYGVVRKSLKVRHARSVLMVRCESPMRLSNGAAASNHEDGW